MNPLTASQDAIAVFVVVLALGGLTTFRYRKLWMKQ
jgi:hypothetical protein